MPPHDSIDEFLARIWREEIVPTLSDYLRIPNVSPAFDPAWEANGHMDRAATLLAQWARGRAIRGLVVEILRGPGLTPLIVCDVPAHGVADSADDTVLIYGHLDKQPEFSGWRDGLSPWEPVMEGERLYGRGGADDGYAIFAALTALEAAQRHGGAHRRVIVLVEASEESGSPDLPAHLDALGRRLGEVGLVVTLDSSASTWDRLWVTTSLRGNAIIDLRVDVLDIGVHSGSAGGIVPSSFRVLRGLLDRVEDAGSGRILIDALYAPVPAHRITEARALAAMLGDDVFARFPVPAGAAPATGDPVEALLDGTWRPCLSVTGADGLPPLSTAGNVLRPFTTARLSFRLPPTTDGAAAAAAVTAELTRDPPPGARVEVFGHDHATGWDAPATAPWLASAVDQGSRRWFGSPPAHEGQGGTIPFMAMLGERFPAAQFLVTGVLGPESNAHGPDEFLDIAYARRLTGCVADVVCAHAQR